ncbi:hypothetical protein HDU93_004259, partial [Gonapodya sp. JEL0774]
MKETKDSITRMLESWLSEFICLPQKNPREMATLAFDGRLLKSSTPAEVLPDLFEKSVMKKRLEVVPQGKVDVQRARTMSLEVVKLKDLELLTEHVKLFETKK